MIAIAYLRRSAKSDDRTVSLQEQQRQVENYCERESLMLVYSLVHDGISGGKRQRFAEIFHAVKCTGAKALVIYNQDRFARDAEGFMGAMRTLISAGVAVHETASGVIDFSDPTKKFGHGMRAVMDEYLREVVGKKTKDALEYKRLNLQQYSHIPPFGFEYVNGEMREHAAEQAALSNIIIKCAARGLGARRTCNELYASGYRGRMGIATIHRLLHSIKEKLPASYFAPNE